MDTITRRRALALLIAPLAAAGCSFDSILSPEAGKRTDRLARPYFDLSGTDGPVVLIGAGDPHAKLNNEAAQRTGRLIKTMLDQNPGSRAFALGDCTAFGTAEEFKHYDAAWGAFKNITDFQIGNHDLLSDSTGTPYYNYAGELAGPRGKGYYAKTYGAWRVYFLNSQVRTAEQTTWLAADLPKWSNYQIMAMWHQPMFASVCAHNGKAMTHPGALGPWWKLLQDYGAELVLCGHVHRYERFARMLRDGSLSDRGIRQFIVGTGGVKPMNILSVHPHSQLQVVNRGVFKLSLYPDRYEWQFTDLSGVVRDSGKELCRKAVVV